MAKPKLTKEAIRFIVETYDSQSENYTYSEIANLVQDKYQIDISIQAVQQNYHKYKRKAEESNKNKLVNQERELHQNHFLNEEEEKLDSKHQSIRIKIQIN